MPPPPQRRYELRQIHRTDNTRRNLLLGSVGAVAVLGVALGLLAQPDLGWLQRTVSTMPPPPPIDSVTAAPAKAAAPPVEVAAAPLPQPVPAALPEPVRPAARLDPSPAPVRTEGPPASRLSTTARPAAPVQVALAPPARPQVALTQPRRVAEPAPPSARAAVDLPTVQAQALPPTRPPPAVIRPGFDCAAAHNVSTRMVCADAELASYDRQLNGAFAQAVRAGVPRAELRADQDDWLQIREDAAHYSRQAVVNVYRQRIGELNALARRPEAYQGLGN